ncbi:MAG: autotransporter domain-containing protein [Alphaproteobacteria bacterium]|nr:autotransporter domain-containing protein [Alphaproteobacteria bacterium]
MSLKNKLGRTVSYSVLLAGVLAAGNALGTEYTSETLKGDVTLEGAENSFTGDLNINNPETTVSLKGDGTLTFGKGNITISGVDKYGEKIQRNSINASDQYTAGLVFGEDFGSADLTDGASIEAGNITIKGGEFNLSGSNNALANDEEVTEENEWIYGTLLDAEGKLTVEGGTINVSDKAQIVAGDVDLKNGTINLNGGDAFLRTFTSSAMSGADPEGNISLGGAEEDKAVINVTGDNAIAVAGDFNLNKNAELNLKNAVLDLVKNMPANEDAEKAAVTNLAGIINVDSSTFNGDITLNGTDVVSEAVQALAKETPEATDEEKLAAALKVAPKANFSGDNTVNGDISNTMGVINVNSGTLTVAEGKTFENMANSIVSVAEGASLKADGITNSGYLDVAGKVNAVVTNTGQVSVKGSNAYIEQLNGGDLEISANTSSSKLFGTENASNVDEAYVSAGNEFTLDNEKFSAGNYVTYGKLALAQDVSGNAKIGNGGTIDLGSNTLTGNVAAWGNSTLAFNVDPTANGKVEGTITTQQKEGEVLTIKPTIALGVESGTYDYATDVEKGDQSEIEPALVVNQDNMLYDVAFAGEDALHQLNIEKKDSSAVAGEVAKAGGDANNASLLNAWVGGDARAFEAGSAAEDMAQHLNTLAQTNPKAAVEAAKALAPEANPVVTTQVTENARQIFNVAGSRLDGATRGMASGDSMIKKAGMWIQGLFNKSKLDKRDGFDVDSEGIAFGADGYVNENVKLGVGYAYTESDIDSVGRKTDADTNTGFVYGEYNAADYYVNGVASYSKGDYKEKKHVAGKLARASYDVDSFALQGIYGYKMGDFSPEAGLRYINAKQDAYTDTAGQHVGSNSSDTLTAILGGRYATNVKAGDYTLRPEVKLAATYDLLRDKNSTAVTLANGAGYLVRGENLKRFGIEAGAGLSMAVSDNVKVGLNYEGRFKEDYTDHTGILEARYNF